MANNIWAIKSISNLLKEAESTEGHTLKRTLTRLNLITLGIGAIVGAEYLFLPTGSSRTRRTRSHHIIYCGRLSQCFAGCAYAEFAL